MSAERKSPRIAVLVSLGVLSIAGLALADQDSNICVGEQAPVPDYSEPLEPLLKIIAENDLVGQDTPFTATDKDLSPASQQALEEYFQKSIDNQIGCTIEIGDQS